MTAIAEASGTSKSVVYRYFRDKDELKDAIGTDVFDHMRARLAEAAARGDSVDDRLQTIVRLYVTAAASSVNVYRFVTQPSQGLSQFLTSCAELAGDILPAAVDREVAAVWGTGAVGFVQATFQWWVDDPDTEMSQDDLTTLISQCLLEGVPR